MILCFQGRAIAVDSVHRLHLAQVHSIDVKLHASAHYGRCSRTGDGVNINRLLVGRHGDNEFIQKLCNLVM